MFTTKKCIAVALALVLLLTSISATMAHGATPPQDQPIVSSYLEAQANPQLSDEAKIKNAVDTYFKLRYEGQKLLKAQDFSFLLADKTQAWVRKEKDKRDIELYIARLFDLKYVSYNYTLDYDAIEIKNNKATVQLRESHQVVFEAIAPEVSVLANLQHTLTLRHEKGVWVIYKDEYKDELSQQLDHTTRADILEQIDKNYQEEQNRKSFGPSDMVAPMAPVNPLALNQYAYNRSLAISYADNWAKSTNPYYKRETADCANFVSQAIYAGMGKSPPDTSGMGTYGQYNTEWYYDYNSKSGSLPWINVPAQYSFVLGNTGSKKGPYGVGSSSYLCYVQGGDVVQLFNVLGGNMWDHEGIVVAVNGPCTSLSNYLVDAHTEDRYHYPLSNWASFQMRYMLIYGWFGN